MLTKRPESPALGQKSFRSRQTDSARALANMCVETTTTIKTQSEREAELLKDFTVFDDDTETPTTTHQVPATSPKSTKKINQKKATHQRKQTTSTTTSTTTTTTKAPHPQLLSSTSAQNLDDEDLFSSYPETVMYSREYITAPMTGSSMSLSTPRFYYRRNEGHGLAYASPFVLALTLSLEICINVFVL